MFESRKTFIMCFRAKHYLLHLNFLLVVYAMQVNFIPLFDLVLCVRIQNHRINQYYCQSYIQLKFVCYVLLFHSSTLTSAVPFLPLSGRIGFPGS